MTHDPIVGGRRRASSEPTFSKPKEPVHAEKTVQAVPDERPVKALPEADEAREDVSQVKPPRYENPVREAWENHLATLRKQWSANKKVCPLCNKFVKAGINGHLSKCLPMEKFRIESLKTTSTDPTMEQR